MLPAVKLIAITKVLICQFNGKNYLQSTMTEKQLNHVMLLHTHKNHSDNINLLEIAKECVSFNDRRINFFWSSLMFNNITQLNIRSAPPNLNFISTPMTSY